MTQPFTRRDWTTIAALTTATALAAAAIGFAGVSATSHLRSQTTTAPTTADTALDNDRTISVSAVGTILDQHTTARTEQDVFGFTTSTCAGFINEDSRRRGATSPADLLSFYARADQYAPPYIINQTTVLTATVTATYSATARLRVNLTDNTHTPPLTEDRTFPLPLVFEGNLWKMCPPLGGIW